MSILPRKMLFFKLITIRKKYIKYKWISNLNFNISNESR